MKLIMKKENWYHNRQVNLRALSQEIESWLSMKGYSTQIHKSEDKPMWLVQAQKKGIFRTIVAANRAFSVIVEGEPNKFYFKTGVSQWITNAPAVGASILLSAGLLGIPVCMSFAWAFKLENDIKKYIHERISFGKKEAAQNSGKIETEGDALILSPEKLKERAIERKFEEKILGLKKAYDVGAINTKEYNSKIDKFKSIMDVEKQLIHLDQALKNKVLTDVEHKTKVQELVKRIETAP